MNEYEARRAAKICRNQALLAELNIKPVISKSDRTNIQKEGQPARKRARLTNDALPTRVSARIAAAPIKPDYNDEPSIKAIIRPAKAIKSATRIKNHIALAEDLNEEASDPPADIETIKQRWTSWKPTAPEPTRSSSPSRRFVFADYPEFTPNKSPEEMLREGAFGGSHYRPLYSRYLRTEVDGDWEQDIPASWLTNLDVKRYVIGREYDPDVNKFKVACGQTIEEWELAGWIAHDYDVRGWFQWYIRFFRGRRCDDDERQISRWRKCVGETGRWRRMLLKKYLQAGVRDVFDDGADEDAPEVSPVMHQTCHHWAYEVRQPDLDQAWAGG